jgi:hypothetical protein
MLDEACAARLRLWIPGADNDAVEYCLRPPCRLSRISYWRAVLHCLPCADRTSGIRNCHTRKGPMVSQDTFAFAILLVIKKVTRRKVRVHGGWVMLKPSGFQAGFRGRCSRESLSQTRVLFTLHLTHSLPPEHYNNSTLSARYDLDFTTCLGNLIYVAQMLQYLAQNGDNSPLSSNMQLS